MEALRAWITRVRWRRRGAWMWPLFIALTVADATLGHVLPWNNDTERFADALLTALFLNLIAVAVLARPGGALVRRYRRDLPKLVARDYAGTALLVAVTAWLAAAGLAHHSTIEAHKRMLADAIVRAQAWIGANARAAEFRRNIQWVETLTIEPGMYRVCVPGDVTRRTYCVIVKERLPLAQSVVPDGYESNATFAQGLG